MSGSPSREVALEHGHPLVEQLGQCLVRPVALPEDVERRLAEQVDDTVVRGRRWLRADEDRDARLGEVEEEALQHDLAEEPGDARQEDGPAREGVHDRTVGSILGRCVLYHAADYPIYRLVDKSGGPTRMSTSRLAPRWSSPSCTGRSAPPTSARDRERGVGRHVPVAHRGGRRARSRHQEGRPSEPGTRVLRRPRVARLAREPRRGRPRRGHGALRATAVRSAAINPASVLGERPAAQGVSWPLRDARHPHARRRTTATRSRGSSRRRSTSRWRRTLVRKDRLPLEDMRCAYADGQVVGDGRRVPLRPVVRRIGRSRARGSGA